METYLTEEERVEALQRWWKENKASVFFGLIMGLLVIVGWKIWQSNRLEKAEQASQVFHQLNQATAAKQTDAALKLGDRLILQYPGTTYAEFARLFMAKIKVDSGDLDGARKMLDQAYHEGKDDALRNLAQLRLGRVMLAQGDVDAGLKLLDSVTEKSVGKFTALFDELRGDLLVAAKRPMDARAAYSKAKETGDLSPLLELKMNELPDSL